jgi:hypothetical protein
MRKRSYCQLLGTLGLLVLLLGSEGCLVLPSRQTKVQAPGGPIELSDIKKTIKNRSFTREIIQDRLGFLDTGISSSSLFWGRWTRTAQLVVIPLAAGATGALVSFAQHPFVENMVAEFDKDGRILQWKIVDDNHLLGRLVPALKRAGDISVQSAKVPSQCAFQWNQLTLVKAVTPKKRIRRQNARQIQLEFFVTPDKKIAACSVDASPEAAYEIFNYMIFNGQDSLLK